MNFPNNSNIFNAVTVFSLCKYLQESIHLTKQFQAPKVKPLAIHEGKLFPVSITLSTFGRNYDYLMGFGLIEYVRNQ